MKNLFLLCLLSFTACTTIKQTPETIEYDSDGEILADTKQSDGACYGKSAVPNQYEETTEEYLNYTGQGVPIGVVEKTIVTDCSYTKWVKKPADRNCQSADPNDCMVWCLVEIPEKTEVVKIVTDTVNIKNFEQKTLVKRKLVKAGGFSQTFEIVCKSDETPDLFMKISTALKVRGYLDDIESSATPKLKAAIVEYQKAKGLPVGNLNILTMNALGVKRK